MRLPASFNNNTADGPSIYRLYTTYRRLDVEMGDRRQTTSAWAACGLRPRLTPRLRRGQRANNNTMPDHQRARGETTSGVGVGVLRTVSCVSV